MSEVTSEKTSANASKKLQPPPKKLKHGDIRIKSSIEYEQQFPDFYFSSAQNGYFCKIFTAFALGEKTGKRAFMDKSGKIGDHPTERFNEHAASGRHLSHKEQANV